MGSTTNKFKLHLAEKLFNSFSTDNIWLFIGKPVAWADDTDPLLLGQQGYTTDSLLAEMQNWDDIMSVQRVSDISYVVPYKEISNNTTFSQYDDNSNIFDSATLDDFFGVSTSGGQYRVYKCISNNSGSTVSNVPTAEQNAVIKSADGYVWKYMYSIGSSDWAKYQVSSEGMGNWMPVKKQLTDDGGGQFNIAMKNAAEGEILHVTTAGSTTFGNVSGSHFADKVGHNVVINRNHTGTGFGSGFTGVVAQHSGVNYYIDVTNGGSDYRKIATIETVTGTTYTDASAHLRPVLSPIGGHGWDAVSELGGFRIMIYAELTTSMTDFILENDFRKVGLITNPYKQGSVFDYIQTVDSTDSYISGEKYSTATNARQLVKIVFEDVDWNNATTAHIQTAATNDTIFTQVDSSGVETDNKARLVEIDGDNKTAYFLVTAGSIDTSVVFQTTTLNYPKMKGLINGTSTTLTIKDSSLSSVTKEKLKKYSGNIIYIDNISSVTRSSESTQKVKLVIEF